MRYLLLSAIIFVAMVVTSCRTEHLSYGQNPVISAIFTPDPAPYVHGNKVYLFADHDEDDASNFFKMKDWVLFSSEDMVNWTYLGTPLTLDTFGWARKGDHAWAAQALQYQGKWYWYVCCHTADGKDALGVAMADNPQGPWHDPIGKPLAVGFSFIDPTVFVDDDGTPYLFWGNKGFWYGELNRDMVSFKDGYKQVPGYTDPQAFGPLQSKMDWSIGKNRDMTQYEEGPWVTKRKGLYYVVYPAGGVPEYMAYSTAPTINGPWTFRGRIMDEAKNSFTIHGGNIRFRGHDYMFYHNGLLPRGGGFHRSTAIEEFKFNKDGSIPFIPFTKEGAKPLGTVNPHRRVEAETMAYSNGVSLDRNDGTEHCVTSIHNGDWIKLYNVNFGKHKARKLTLGIRNFKHSGTIAFCLDNIDAVPFATVTLQDSNTTQIITELHNSIHGVHDVYIRFIADTGSELFDFDWWQISANNNF